MEFITELYRRQADAGRYFLHEHPAWATSWGLKCVQDVLRQEDVATVIGDQCQYGQCDLEGNPIMKPTKWMSNSPGILSKLGQRCPGAHGACSR